MSQPKSLPQGFTVGQLSFAHSLVSDSFISNSHQQAIAGNGIRPDVTAPFKHQFNQAIQEDSLAFFADHQVYGRATVPATFYVELAIAAAQSVQSAPQVTVENFAIHQALFLKPQQPQTVQFSMGEGESDTAFQIVSKPVSTLAKTKLAESQLAEPKLHVSGRIRRQGTPASTPTTNLADQVLALSAMAPAEFYQACEARGISYGPTFQVIRQLWRKDGEALGKVQLNEPLLPGLDAYQVHPVLLDSCLQVLWAALPEAENGKTYLPIAIESLTVYPAQLSGDRAASVWSHANIRTAEDSAGTASGGAKIADLCLFDETGNILVALSGVLVGQVSEAALGAANTKSADSDFNTLAIAATFTAEPVEAPLTYWQQVGNLPYKPEFAPFNQVFQTLLSPESITSKNTDGVNVILVRLEDWDEPIVPLPLQVEPADRVRLLSETLSTQLPNQLEIAHLNPYETEYLFQELFIDLVYLKRGITLKDGDCVVDIGANIGLFTLFAQQQCPNGSIYSFEPAPHAFDKLKRNADLYCTNAHLFNCGVSGQNTTETFTFYPNSSVFSSFSAEDDTDEKAIRAVIMNMLERDGSLSETDMDALADEFLSDRLQKETYQAQLRTLSSVIEECGIERIDLLKLDAEKSELPVLRGIKDEHWPMIQQMVIEVHDQVGDIIAEVKQILTDRGFDWEIDEEDMLQSSGLYNIYAIRPAVKAAATPPAASAELSRNVEDFCSALTAAAARSSAPYLVALCPPSQRALAAPNRQGIYRQLQSQITEHISNTQGVQLLNPDLLADTYATGSYDNPKGDEFGVPYKPDFFAGLATAIARSVSATTRNPYKVIVLDCDNTLWHGVCGEDGATGIDISPEFETLQTRMVAQQAAGMLLCLCSKNSEADVWAVFEHRPNMPLKKEHLVTSRINWQPKSENIKALANELNLGLDSFIFIDDNPVECAEVQASCPEVLTLQLPTETSEIPEFLTHVWAFDQFNATAEDAQRTKRYQQNVQREAFRSETLTFSDFLAGLNLNVAIQPMAEASLARVSQLTQRTNQFNLTTIRCSESDIQQLLSQGYECLTVDVSDRFGDYGTVGTMIYRPTETALELHSLMLSCRSLGRGVEYQMIAKLGEIAQARNLSRVDITFTPTEKNQPALDFLNTIAASYQTSDSQATGSTRFVLPAEVAAQLVYSPQSDTALTESPSTSQQKAAKTQSVAATSSQPQVLARIAAERIRPAQIVEAIAGQQQQQARPELDKAFVAPTSTVEAELAKIWGEVLGLSEVGIHDNFFELGGKSLLMVQVHSQICDRFDSDISPVELFKYTTIATLAERLNQVQSQAKPKAQVSDRADRKRQARNKRQQRRERRR